MAPLWRDFLRDLGKPEYLHVLLNPLPTYGLGIALAGLVAALLFRSRGAQTLALAGIVLFGASAWAAAHYGHAAYDRVYSMSDDEAQLWLNWHAYLGDRLVWADTAAAVAALATLVALRRFPRRAGAALAGTLVLGALALLFGAFLAFVGGKIRHPEFRHGPPPVRLPAQD